MITICPLCFIDFNPVVRNVSSRERRKRKKVERVSNKSKGLLESSLFSLFRKPEPAPKIQPVKKEKRKDRDRLDKSKAADYASFEINTGYPVGIPVISDIVTEENPSITSSPLSEDRSAHKPSYEPPKPPKPSKSLKPSYSPPSSGEVRAKEHYQKGRTYEQEGRLKEALVEYVQAIGFYPSWTDPYHRAGLIMLKNKDYKSALDKFKEVVKLDPSNADAYYQMGKIYLKENFKDDAAIYFKKALKTNPRLRAAKKELEKLERMYSKVSSSMKIMCKNCGAFQPARAKFCGNCGGKVT